MTVELISLILALLGTLVTGYGAYNSSKKPVSRRLVIASCALATLGLLSGFELSYRAWNIQFQKEELERSWSISQTQRIQSIIVEVISDKGVIASDQLLKFASGIRLHIPNPKLALPTVVQNGLPLSQFFNLEHIKRAGFSGLAQSTIETRRTLWGTGEDKSKIVDVSCILSESQARSAGEKSPFLSLLAPNKLACALRISIDISDRNITLSALLDSKDVTVTTPTEVPRPCFGPCLNLIVSIRAVLPSIDGLTPFMLELSPSSYLARASRIEDGHAVFSLPAATLNELAKSYFMQSYGYRNRRMFPFTLGMVSNVYAWATTRQELLEPVDIIWTTEGPDEDAIRGLIAEPRPDIVTLLELPEWCGFGREPFCWRRFLVVRPSTSK